MSMTGRAREVGNDESATSSDIKLKGRDYDRELATLHVELVKLQLWVQHKGLKVCVVFEGRDGAGKGGVIKAITERVSPRVFRVVALPAPTEREKSQMYLQRYIPHLPAAGEIVIFDRSWYNRAGVERVMGFCSDEQVKRFLTLSRESRGRVWYYPVEILVGGEPGRADTPTGSPHRRWQKDMEAVSDGS
jgi:polyphosphate kinase